jgi:hypothetical protein
VSSPEYEFQRGQPVHARFLFEVVSNIGALGASSAFDASIILATVSGRCLTHGQQCLVEQVYSSVCNSLHEHSTGGINHDSLMRHQKLDALTTKLIANVATDLPEDTDDTAYSFLLFVKMTAHANVLLLYKAMRTTSCTEDAIAAYEQKAIRAAVDIARLAQKTYSLVYFKVWTSSTRGVVMGTQLY